MNKEAVGGSTPRTRPSLHADLNQVLLEQRGKRVHLGELLLQGGKVAKTDLVSALAEISDVP